ncbi:MAG: hypothetical protein IPM64_00345 [Phycisphaerales bacterium]|nr:hypothetical protein [Phycisphaerales bacterium]
MPDMQRELFTWVTHQHGTVGLALFALGMLYAFMGFRFYAAMTALSCAFIGWMVGAFTAPIAEMDPLIGGIAGGVAGAGLAVASRRGAAMVAAAATWGALVCYLLHQVGVMPPTLTAATAVGAILGCGFVCFCRHAPIAVNTALQGVMLIVVGWVGLSTAFVPSIGRTFVVWASGWEMLVPGLLLMLFVTGYSYQAMNLRGDIRTGAA